MDPDPAQLEKESGSVDYGLYQDKNNFINPLLQVGSNEKKYQIRIRRAKNQRIRPDPHPCFSSFLPFLKKND